MDINKNQNMIDYLMTCAFISSGSLFFNYAEESESTYSFLTVADDKDLQKPYIDGSVLKRYTFQLICYKPLSNNPLVNEAGFIDENMQNLEEVQKVLDWIEEQESIRNYPYFGDLIQPERIYCMTNDPNLFAIDTESDPALAKYSVVVRFEYLDKTKMLFS